MLSNESTLGSLSIKRDPMALKEEAILNIELRLGCGTCFRTGDLVKQDLTLLYGTSEISGAIHKYAGILKETDNIPVNLRHADYNLNNLYLDRGNINSVQIVTGRLSRKKFGKPFKRPDRLQEYYKERQKPSWHYLTDIDIEVELITQLPQLVEQIKTLYREDVKALDNEPCIIQTKSGGIRLTGYVPELLKKKKIFKVHSDLETDQKQASVMLEIFGDKNYSRVNHKYSMLEGSLLNIPQLSEDFIENVERLLNNNGLINESAFKKIKKPIVNKNAVKPIDNFNHDDLSEEHLEFIRKNQESITSDSYFGKIPCPKEEHEHDGWDSKSNATGVQLIDSGYQFHCFKCDAFYTYSVDGKGTSQEVKRTNPSEEPCFPYWTEEERTLLKQDNVRVDPDAGYFYKEGLLFPAFTTNYVNLSDNKINDFTRNGEPPEIFKRRIWYDLETNKCGKCGCDSHIWIDRPFEQVGYYCPDCHDNFLFNTSLNVELNRQLDNKIVSPIKLTKEDYENRDSSFKGYILNDPYFESFGSLWESRNIKLLAAAMGTGKSFTIFEKGIELVDNEDKFLIYCVPTVSLARSLWYSVTEQYGQTAFGLYHEGASSDLKRLGTKGVICVLPSLVNVMRSFDRRGYTLDRALIAIDEVDFSYRLTKLPGNQSRKVKEILRDGFENNGLVIAGQTEWTSTLEALGAELGAEPTEIKGFYKNSWPADGQCYLNEYPAKITELELITEVDRKIEEVLLDGKNAYVFTTTREQAELLARKWSDYNPVSYNAYDKGTTLSDQTLKEQRLPDGSRVGFFTSAAAVGINIRDDKAITIKLLTNLMGKKLMYNAVQEVNRVRNRNDIYIYYSIEKEDASLPLSRADAIKTSLFENKMKAIKSSDNIWSSEEGIKKIAIAQGLNDLASADPKVYFGHHIRRVGNMQLEYKQCSVPVVEDADIWKERKKDIKSFEKRERKRFAFQIIEQRNYWPQGELRTRTFELSLTKMKRLGGETINEILGLLGWTDRDYSYDKNGIDKQKKRIVPYVPEGAWILKPEITELIGAIVNCSIRLEEDKGLEPFNIGRTRTQIRGYFAKHFPRLVNKKFRADYEKTKEYGTQELVNIRDDRFKGSLLNVLFNAIGTDLIKEDDLLVAINRALNTESEIYDDQTFRQLLLNGALGPSWTRKTRFISIGQSDLLIMFVRDFIRTYYPVILHKRIVNKKVYYQLIEEKNRALIFDVIKTRMLYSTTHQMEIPANGILPYLALNELIDPSAEQKELARELRKENKTLKTIAEETGLSYTAVREITSDLEDRLASQKEEAVRLRRSGLTLMEVVSKTNLSYDTVVKITKGIEIVRGTKEDARLLRSQGYTIEQITEHLGIAIESCRRMVKGVKPTLSENAFLVWEIMNDDENWKRSELIKVAGLSPDRFKKALKDLLDNEKIELVKRGVYRAIEEYPLVPLEKQELEDEPDLDSEPDESKPKTLEESVLDGIEF